MDDLSKLTPTQDLILDKTIENINRKLIAGYRNRDLNPPKNEKPGTKSTIKKSIESASADSAIEVANRGKLWKELMGKSFSHGISSLATLQFDESFSVENGIPTGLNKISSGPGVYVVYDKNDKIKYIGDSENVQKRWHSGHLNENKQKTDYKLNKEFKEGCKVKVINTESKESAAALEAHLISEGRKSDQFEIINSREELKEEQGSRSNIEAKKAKDELNSPTDLAIGAGKEAMINSGWSIMEEIINECTRSLKNEMIDIFKGGKSDIISRLKRLITSITKALKSQFNSISNLAKGAVEFIINSFKSAISQIYNLTKNIYQLGQSAWALYKNKETMSKDELIKNLTETILIGTNAAFWNGMDMAIESSIVGATGAFAPFIAAFISALGFGISSYYLGEFIPKILDWIIGSYSETKSNLEESARNIIESSRLNVDLISSLEKYTLSTVSLIKETNIHKDKLKAVKQSTLTVRSEIDF